VQFALILYARRNVPPVDLNDLGSFLRLAELAYGDAGDTDGVELRRSVPSIVITVESMLVSLAPLRKLSFCMPGIQHRKLLQQADVVLKFICIVGIHRPQI
jgi:hypothetical protein